MNKRRRQTLSFRVVGCALFIITALATISGRIIDQPWRERMAEYESLARLASAEVLYGPLVPGHTAPPPDYP